ncbi:hypothetical protein AHAS_Ahas13G0281500 [Arachis hypogaea]
MVQIKGETTIPNNKIKARDTNSLTKDKPKYLNSHNLKFHKLLTLLLLHANLPWMTLFEPFFNSKGNFEPSFKSFYPDEDNVEVEDVEDEEEAQEVVEEKKDQARARGSRKEDVLEDPISIPFLTLAKKAKKQLELDPKMADIFKNVEVSKASMGCRNERKSMQKGRNHEEMKFGSFSTRAYAQEGFARDAYA